MDDEGLEIRARAIWCLAGNLCERMGRGNFMIDLHFHVETKYEGSDIWLYLWRVRFNDFLCSLFIWELDDW